MKTKNVVFILLLITLNTFSQFKHKESGSVFDHGIIHFKGDSIIKGKMKISFDQKLIHLKNNEPIIYNYKNIEKVKLKNSSGEIETYCFKRRNEEIVLLKRVVKGKVELLIEEMYVTETGVPIGLGFGGFSLSVISGGGGETLRTKYYLAKQNSLDAINVPDNVKRKRFRKTVQSLYTNCNESLAKINDKKSIIENFGEEPNLHAKIIESLNTSCN